jgi:hypothetical protein
MRERVGQANPSKGTSMTEEDEEFQRLEREAKMRRMVEEDDDTQVYKKPWVGLTNNELQPIADEYRILFGSWVEDFARAIEAKLREKNA